MAQQHERPRARGDLDLTEIDGEPTAAAQQAYARQKSDVQIRGESRLPFGGRFTFGVDADERSQLVTVITYAIAVLVAVAAGFSLRAIGLGAIPSALAGSVVWAAMSLGVFLHDRRR